MNVLADQDIGLGALLLFIVKLKGAQWYKSLSRFSEPIY